MADNDHDLDDFDIDDGLDIPDFDDAGLDGSGGNNRKPVERVAGGFLQGVRDTSMKRGFQRKLIENALPKGYGKAFDDVSEAASVGQDLYNSTTSALRPYQRTIKKIGRRVSDKADKFLPDSLSKKLKELTEPDNDRAEQIDPLESKITSELGEIFGAQMEANAEERAADSNRENVKDVVEEQRHNTNIDVLKTIRSGQDRLVAYQDKITAGYQRKSLEYQIRQLNVSRRQYELLEGHVKENKVQMDAIAKNTALPEFVKLRGSEAAKQIVRQRLLGNMTEGLQDRLRGAGGRFKENLEKRAKAFQQSLVESIQGAGDAMEMSEGIQIDGLEMAGSMAGGMALEEAASPLGRRLGTQLRRIPGIERFGDTLEHGSDNKEELIRRFLRSQANDTGPKDPDFVDERTGLQKARDTISGGTAGLRSGAANFLLELMGPEYSPERTLGGQTSIEAAQEVVPYTSMTDRAITEIIPDILTNILHETEMIRTGDDTIGRRIYDVDRRTMRREEDVQKSIMQRVLPENSMEGIREDLDKLVAGIDVDGTLSDSARASFKRQVLEDMVSNKGFLPERFTEAGGLSSVESESDAEAIQSLIRKRFLDEDGKVRNTDDVRQTQRALGRQYQSTQKDIPDYQKVVSEVNALYGPEMLRKMGIMAGDETSETSNRLDTRSILDNALYGMKMNDYGMEALRAPRIVSEPVVAEPEPQEDAFDRVNRMTLDTSPLPEPEPESQLVGIMTRVAKSVDRLVSSFAGRTMDTVEEYLNLLVDRTSESEEYLNLLVDHVSSLVKVQTSANNEEQFKHVLTAIDDIDPNDGIATSNSWLKKIYDLMLKCCGPDGNGPGPGGPRGGGPSGGPRFKPLENIPNLKVPEWVRNRAQDGTTLIGTARERLSSAGTSVSNMVDQAKQVDYRTKASESFGALTGAAGTAGDRVKSALAPVRSTLDQGMSSLKGNVQFQRVGSATESMKDKLASLGIEDRVRSLTEIGLGDIDKDVLYNKVQDVLNYDYAGRGNDAVEALKSLSKDDLVSLVTQFDREQAMETAKSKVTETADRARQGAESAMGKLTSMLESAKSMNRPSIDKDWLNDMQGKAVGVKDRMMGAVKGRTSQLKIPNNLVDFEKFKLENQPRLQALDMDDFKSAVGESFGSYSDSLSRRASGFSSEVGDRFDVLKSSTTDALGDVRRRFSEMDLGKVGTDDEAANDPKLVLSMLKQQAKKTLEALEKADVSSEASSYLDSLKSKTSSLFGDMRGAITKRMEARQVSDAGAPQTEHSGGGGGFWSEARNMLAEIKDHMDRKTSELVDAIQNISLLGGDGDKKPGALKRLGGKAADGVGGILSYYGSMFKTGGNLIAGASQGARGILGGIGGRIGGMIRGKDKEDPIVDIYLEGREEPIMLARDLRMDKYICRDTGEFVKRLSDIKGAVLDENANVVVSQEDVAEGRLYTQGGPSGGGIKKLGKMAFNYTTMPSRMLFKLGGKALTAGRDYLNRPQDIYVKGEEKPRLLAVILKSGGYFSAATGEPIYTIADIDGPVKNRDGNIVLTEDDIRQGLVNARGKAIRTGVSAGASLASSAISGVAGFYRGAWEMGKGAVNKVAGLFGGGDGEGGGSLFGGSKKQVEWLEKIYNILDARLEKPEKEVRQGSWQQLMGKNADGTAANDPNNPDAESADSPRRSLFDMLSGGGILDMLNPFSGDGFGSSAAGAAAGSAADRVLDRDGRKERRENRRNNKRSRGKGGMLGRLWQGTKKVAGTAARVALPAAAMLGKGALALGGKALAGAGMAAAGIGSVLSAPVVLAGAAVAAVGIGAYMLYKHFSDRPEGPIHKFRLAQYGVDPTDKDHVAKLNALEDKLSGEVQYRTGQSPTLSEGLDIEELVQITGVDPEDANAVQNWALWFQRRFKPVFFSHMAMINEVKSGTKPSKIDATVDKEKKAAFIKGVHFKDGADGLYSVMASPFPETEELMGPGHVQSVYESALTEVEGQVKESTANAGRSFPNPERLGTDTTPNEIATVVPKKTSASDDLTVGVEKRKTQSATNKIALAEDEAAAAVEKETPVLSEQDRLKKYEDDGMDSMDAYRRQVARKAAYDRHGLPSDHIVIPTLNRQAANDTGEEERPVRPIQQAPKPVERTTRAWGQAMDMTSTPETVDDERVVEERKRKESRVVKQTETQMASNTAQMNTTMNRMVGILTDSHGVQKDIRDTLSTMNRMFKERYEKDDQEKNRDKFRPSKTEDGGWFSGLFNKDEEPTPKPRQVDNSR